MNAAPSHARRPKFTCVDIAREGKTAVVVTGGREVSLTNLDKLFWLDLGIARRDLLPYYASIAPVLLPHLAERAMAMKRYPHGAHGEFLFQKRAPAQRPEWIRICSIEHVSAASISIPDMRAGDGAPGARCAGEARHPEFLRRRGDGRWRRPIRCGRSQARR